MSLFYIFLWHHPSPECRGGVRLVVTTLTITDSKPFFWYGLALSGEIHPSQQKAGDYLTMEEEVITWNEQDDSGLLIMYLLKHFFCEFSFFIIVRELMKWKVCKCLNPKTLLTNIFVVIMMYPKAIADGGSAIHYILREPGRGIHLKPTPFGWHFKRHLTKAQFGHFQIATARPLTF